MITHCMREEGVGIEDGVGGSRVAQGKAFSFANFVVSSSLHSAPAASLTK